MSRADTVVLVHGAERAFIALVLLLVAPVVCGSKAGAQRDSVVVSRSGAVRTVAEALRSVRAGGRVVVRAGAYREPTIVVERPVTIVGDSGAVLNGENTREIITDKADDVTIRGLALRHSRT